MIAPQQVILRLVIATVLGSIVGLERERLDRAAGLRTHALVGLGACLFMLVSAFGFADIMDSPRVSLDPSRVAIEMDRRIVKREEWAARRPADGARIEIVQFVGGG